MTAYLDAMRRYFDFSGRSTRSQFWLFTLFYMIILFVAMMLDGMLGTDPTGQSFLLGGLVSLLHFIPSLSVLVRRLHDIGRTGWWVLFGMIPVIGWITLLVFVCTPSQTSAMAEDGPVTYGRRDPNMTTPAQPAGAVAGGNTVEQLEKLAALKTSGTISEEEFARMKADLLQSGR